MQHQDYDGDRDGLGFFRGLIIAAPISLALWALIGYAFYYALTLPIVYEAYPSGECVRVDDVNGRYSCENMPTKYHHEWVMQER